MFSVFSMFSQLTPFLPSVMAGWNNLWSPDMILCWLSKNHNICVWRTWSWVTQKCGALNLFWMKWRICACLSQLYCKIWVKRWIVGEKNRRRKEKKVFMWKCAQCNLASVCRWGPRGKSCYRRADLASTARRGRPPAVFSFGLFLYFYCLEV